MAIYTVYLTVSPIIFLTAKTDKEDIVKGFKLGAIDFDPPTIQWTVN